MNRQPGRPGKPPIAAPRQCPSGWAVVGVAAVLLFAGAVGFGVYRSQHTNGAAIAPRDDQHANGPLIIPSGASATGVTLGKPDAPATIEVYLDLQCPVCRVFEKQSGPTIDQLVASGQATVTYHPLAFLDRFSSTRYSSRAAAATGCASGAGVYAAFQTLLFENQPPEGGDGLPDDQLIALGRQAGAGEQFAGCVHDQRYAPWVAALTDEASQAGVSATPTVLVNGREIGHTEQALRVAVQAAAR